MKQVKNWREMKITDGALVVIDVKSEMVAVIPPTEINVDELKKLNVTFVETPTKDYFVSLQEDLTPSVYNKPIKDVQGKCLHVSQTNGKIQIKKFHERTNGKMEVKVYVFDNDEPMFLKTYKPVKEVIVEIKTRDYYEEYDQVRENHYSGYEIIPVMEYIYINGMTERVEKQKKCFEAIAPHVYVYRNSSGEIVTEAEAKSLNGAKYYLTKTGAYCEPVKDYIERERPRQEWENYYPGYRPVEKIPVLGEKEPCKIEEIPEDCDSIGDEWNEKFARVRQMYQKHGSVEGALKALKEYKKEKEKFNSEVMPKLKADAEEWIKISLKD